MAEKGRVMSINISTAKGVRKTPVPSIIVNGRGFEGDAHAGDWHRQVSLLAEESIDRMREIVRETGIELQHGDFAENITTKGLDLLSLPVGQRIRIGDEVVLEITQHGKECHFGCEIRKQVGDCIMPREGIFARVVSTGNVKVGDIITILDE